MFDNNKMEEIQYYYNEVRFLDKEADEKSLEYFLKTQREDGSWAIAEWNECESDVRVGLCYFPTYYATAALMEIDKTRYFEEDSKERQALLKGLNVAMGRKLRGHGFEATEQMLQALEIYRWALTFFWMAQERNRDLPFCKMVEEIIMDLREKVKNKDTFDGWGNDYSERMKDLISAYDDAFSGAKTKYVWYACYGSNINKERFLKYIKKCTNKSLPLQEKPYLFFHNVYFAKYSRRWKGGKAFLDDTCPGLALGKIYKITEEQLKEIQANEGNDYTKLVELGTIKGLQVFTFTDQQKNEKETAPSKSYYTTILKGLEECWSPMMAKKDIAKMLDSAIRVPAPVMEEPIKEKTEEENNN